MSLSIRTARATDAKIIAATIRTIDEIECRAHGRSPRRAMLNGMRLGMAWTVTRDGFPIAMFGVAAVSLLDGHGRPWLLGSTALDGERRRWLTLGRKWVRLMRAQYPRLDNWIAQENVASRLWLAHLGFDFDPEIVHIGDVPFRRFHLGF